MNLSKIFVFAPVVAASAAIAIVPMASATPAVAVAPGVAIHTQKPNGVYVYNKKLRIGSHITTRAVLAFGGGIEAAKAQKFGVITALTPTTFTVRWWDGKVRTVGEWDETKYYGPI
ncbi:hypothetical protein [Tsukamurella sp. NPDC003166]|uniref:hypothetical protein n=1 Tax=Tsukamurella sp. NPDC003166 TaxID=3154444 RepID=UPI0033A2459C